MEYYIEFDAQKKRNYLIEYVGSEPANYECRSGWCWRDCVPCKYCEDSIKVIPDREKWTEWKIKYDNRKIIPCSQKDEKFFTDWKLQKGLMNENHFGIINGEANPIQLKLNI